MTYTNGMRIAIFTDVFLPHTDGVATSTNNLALEFTRKGHAVFVAAPYQKSKTELINAYPIYRLPSVPALVYPDIRLGLLDPRLLLEMRRFKPDIVHIQTPASVGFQGQLAARLLRVPMVGTFHTYLMEPEYLRVVGITTGTKYVQSMLWRVVRAFYDQCQDIISPSKYVKDDLLHHGFKKPITVIHNGLRLGGGDVDTKMQQTFKKRWGLGERVVLYVGRLSVEKNLNALVKAFSIASGEDATAQLLIVGDGPVKQDLQRQAVQLGIENRVIFTGEIPHDQLLKAGIYELAYIFATCSVSEVQPMSVLEAMAGGLPVIMVRVKGNTELIDNNGYLTDPATEDDFTQKLIYLLKNPIERTKMSEASLKKAREFDLEYTANEHIGLYSRLLSN